MLDALELYYAQKYAGIIRQGLILGLYEYIYLLYMYAVLWTVTHSVRNLLCYRFNARPIGNDKQNTQSIGS